MSTFFSLLRDVETNNRQKYITPSLTTSLTTSILPGYCDCAGKVHAVFPPPPFFSYAQASFSQSRVQESMLAVSSRRTYDCHLKEALLSSSLSTRVACRLASRSKTAQAISPLLSSVTLALYVSLLSIEIFDFLNSEGRKVDVVVPYNRKSHL